MKKIFLLILSISLGVANLFAQETKAPQAEITFTKTVHDFGIVWDGLPVEYTFEFTNTGKAPLILSNVQPSCGCTAPNWPKEPIMPGQKSKIVVTYSAGSYRNTFNKTITVTSNASNSSLVLTIKGNVKDKPREPQSPVKTQPAEGGF
ncbi:MAG: DUF1573 domain-containing protein [Bacteroidota bacterium]